MNKQIYMNNTAILCFVLGWQGGTVHQVAEILYAALNEMAPQTFNEKDMVQMILNAGEADMILYCRIAQKIHKAAVRQQVLEEIKQNSENKQ